MYGLIIRINVRFANDRHREINVRIVSFPVVDLIRNLRAFHINKLVNVVGNDEDGCSGGSGGHINGVSLLHNHS